MEFPRQEYWSGLPFPSPGDIPDPGIKSRSPSLTGEFFTVLSQQRSPINSEVVVKYYHMSGRGLSSKEDKNKEAMQNWETRNIVVVLFKILQFSSC